MISVRCLAAGSGRTQDVAGVLANTAGQNRYKFKFDGTQASRLANKRNQENKFRSVCVCVCVCVYVCVCVCVCIYIYHCKLLLTFNGEPVL